MENMASKPTGLRQITAFSRGLPGGGALPFRQQGRAVPGGAHAPSGSDEPGARCPARPAGKPRAGQAATCEAIIGAMFIPALKLAAAFPAAASIFCVLLGRAYACTLSILSGISSAISTLRTIGILKRAIMARTDRQEPPDEGRRIGVGAPQETQEIVAAAAQDRAPAAARE